MRADFICQCLFCFCCQMDEWMSDLHLNTIFLELQSMWDHVKYNVD